MTWLSEMFPAFAAAVGDYRYRGELYARGRCPNREAHRRNDKAPSLLMELGRRRENGGHSLVFCCRAGCSKSQILAAAGLTWRDVCWDRPLVKEAYRPPMIVADYHYRRPDGTTAYSVRRYFPKDFRPWRYLPSVGSGTERVVRMLAGWVERVPDRDDRSAFMWQECRDPGADCNPRTHRRVEAADLWPYNADRLWNETGRLVFWVEGEKTADNLCRAGFLATTTQGGASGRYWGGRHWDRLFRGRDVVHLADHDDPGYEYQAYYLGRLLQARARLVLPLRLPHLPEKGDYDDWAFRLTQEGQDPAEQLRLLVRKATGWSRCKVESVFNNRVGRKKGTYVGATEDGGDG